MGAVPELAPPARRGRAVAVAGLDPAGLAAEVIAACRVDRVLVVGEPMGGENIPGVVALRDRREKALVIDALLRRLVLNQLYSVAGVVADERERFGRRVAHLEHYLDPFGFQLRQDSGQVLHLEAEVLHAMRPEVF